MSLQGSGISTLRDAEDAASDSSGVPEDDVEEASFDADDAPDGPGVEGLSDSV